jgi:hypothetical protein
MHFTETPLRSHPEAASYRCSSRIRLVLHPAARWGGVADTEIESADPNRTSDAKAWRLIMAISI